MRISPDGRPKNKFTVRKDLIMGTSYILKTDKRYYPLLDNNCSFCYVIMGAGEIRCDDGRVFPFHAGDLIAAMDGVPRTRYLADEDYLDQYIVLPREFFSVIRKMELYDPDNPILSPGLREDIIDQISNMEDRLREIAECDLPLIYPRIFDLVIHLIMNATKQPVRYQSQLADAAELLENSQKSIPEIASSLNMSQTNFRRLFTSAYHQAPSEYRIRKRLEQAAGALLSGTKSVKEIAAQFGYPDIFSFSRQFKKYTGYSPCDYRRRMN